MQIHTYSADTTYGLFKGITFVRPKSKERQLMQERKEKAMTLSRNYEEARKQYEDLEVAKEYVNSIFAEGVRIHHKKYGDGIIEKNNGTIITVEFPEEGKKQLGTFVSASNGIIAVDIEGYAEKMADYGDVLRKEGAIKSGLSYAEKELAPYTDYLE